MKKFILFSLLLSILISTQVLGQSFVVEGEWKLSFEDNKDFSQPGYDDAGWENIKELTWADDHKTTANRTLWVRKSIVIPSSLKQAFEKTGLITLSMGKISQSDDTYLNGKRIGSTGSGDTYRNYSVSMDEILWDQENTIAIRVRHWGSFRISIIPKFIASEPSIFFEYKSVIKDAKAKEPVVNKELLYELSIQNKSPKKVDGFVKADFYDFKGAKLYTSEKNVILSTGNNPIEFPYKSVSPFIKIVYTISVPLYQYTSQWNAEFGYENVKYKKMQPTVAYKAPQKYNPADLSKITIKGWLGERLQANTQQRLHKVDEDAILAGYINRPGNHSWIGEHIGKFLEAACNAYENNADPVLKAQIDRSAQQLIAAQLSDGYLGTYDKQSHWTSWDVWSHRYNMKGLLRYYELSGFKPALIACEKMGDLIIKTFGPEEGQKDIVRAGGHVGMAATCILESMGELYRFNGDKKYLDYCYYLIKSFNNPKGPEILKTLYDTERVDKVANAKAYEMMSNFLGIIKLYRLTNDAYFLIPLEIAWKDIVDSRLYITGTTSSFEHFQGDHVLPATNKDNMGEGCVTTTWVQFNFQLFCITGQMKYLDELERSTYNHLTGAENPITGGVSYYTPLMGVKPFSTSITCCMSSVPRGIAMIPLFANGKLNNNPAFLFYQPGIYATTIGEKNISFTTQGNFLNNESMDITVNDNSTTVYAIEFRKPYWAVNFNIAINGKKQTIGNSETVNIKRVWKKGDKVAINFTMETMVLEGGKSYPNQIALQRGPQILAFDKIINGFNTDGLSLDAGKIQLQESNYVMPKNWVGSEKFQLKATVNNIDKNIILVPYADASQTGGEVSTWLKKQ